jgi:hypothetical protein
MQQKKTLRLERRDEGAAQKHQSGDPATTGGLVMEVPLCLWSCDSFSERDESGPSQRNSFPSLRQSQQGPVGTPVASHKQNRLK